MADYKALVIDYEPRGIRQLREPLENAGFEVHVALDGEAGRRAFDRLKPDIAVIEAMLPKRHGFDLCADLKKTPHGAKTPIVIVTSVYRGRKYRNQAIHQYGCDEFLEKPVEAERLLATVRRLLGASGEEGPAPEPQAPAPAPAAAPAVARTAGGSKAADHDDTEDEISRRLDELLGGDSGSGSPKASLAELVPPSNPVVQFDLDRPRRSRESLHHAGPYLAAPSRGGMAGGGARHAHAVAPPEARPMPMTEPELRQGRIQPPVARPRPGTPPPSSRRLRLLMILLVLTIGLALLSELLRG